MVRPGEKKLPPPPRPGAPHEVQRLFGSPKAQSPSPSSSTSSSLLSPCSLPLPSTPKDSLSSQIQRLEDENDSLRRKVGELQEALDTLQRKHATDLTAKTTLLRKQNYECNRRINRQNELVTNLVNTVYTVFSDYKEEVSLLNRISEDDEGSDEIRVYSTLDGQTWI
ncbi:hypothetical protein F5Y06DRAFT_274165 [Hypoxylon sp. FL0890]|nr:hypothetical protein F5Y06DRAFT_274165 [Hypoxylon sp. FL0890]